MSPSYRCLNVGFVMSLLFFSSIVTTAQAQTGAAVEAPAVSGAESSPIWSRDGDGKISVRATRIARSPRIDGKLDDEIYAEVRPFTEMVQQQPKPGAPGTELTEAWLLFDDDNVYI